MIGDAEAVLQRLDKGLIGIRLLLGLLFYEKYDYMSKASTQSAERVGREIKRTVGGNCCDVTTAYRRAEYTIGERIALILP